MAPHPSSVSVTGLFVYVDWRSSVRGDRDSKVVKLKLVGFKSCSLRKMGVVYENFAPFIFCEETLNPLILSHLFWTEYFLCDVAL